ncbi:hypothetical protein HD554DRAFT_2130443 [Boletus coccyginus]|nr:hypothetical protein HD554DRAFT_2130443 [Boletus coccyginus]
MVVAYPWYATPLTPDIHVPAYPYRTNSHTHNDLVSWALPLRGFVVCARVTILPCPPTAFAVPTNDGNLIPQTLQVSLAFLISGNRKTTQSFGPDTTVGRVKELVWNAWPALDVDWQEERPPTLSYLRILHLGGDCKATIRYYVHGKLRAVSGTVSS